jgi:hypothetical protein
MYAPSPSYLPALGCSGTPNAFATGSQMTHILNSKQYAVVAISGAHYSGELLAFRLAG